MLMAICKHKVSSGSMGQGLVKKCQKTCKKLQVEKIAIKHCILKLSLKLHLPLPNDYKGVIKIQNSVVVVVVDPFI